MAEEPFGLRSLSPEYQPDEHGEYVRILLAELQRSGPGAARNIALTGHYGSGKSSVLVEVQHQLTEKEITVINLSLPSLGVGDARLETPGEATTLDTTNLIQKEIVKQLLYRRKPSDTPASRYNRLDVFQVEQARKRAAGAATGLTAVALLAHVPARVKASFPAAFWDWFKSHHAGGVGPSLQWLSLAVVFALAYGAVIWAQRLFHQRLRLTELAAGPAKVTLSENSTSFFDEYLDEIVYFFQNSKTTVVIFEDLDRFEDPHIFETLRELNLLLNNAEQTGTEPIRFVYAIRDSIFEELDEDDDEPVDQVARALPVELRRRMTTNRTKFFDLVVPMVPFISHRTSRELIRSTLSTVEAAHHPSPAVIDLVSVYLTDMRLIKNICNEYDVFRTRILGEAGLEGLTPDRLFASIVYKNVYMGDYERIRNGESLLDDLYASFRDWVAQRAAAAREVEQSSRQRLTATTATAIAARSRRLGARLQTVVNAVASQQISPQQVQLTVNGTTYSWSDLRGADFWRAYLADPQVLSVVYNPPYGGVGQAHSFEDLQTLINEPLSASDWETADRSRQREAMTAAAKEQRAVSQASMTDALGETGMPFEHNGQTMSLSDVAGDLFQEAKLARDLLTAGYLDENFALYVTQFPGQGSAAAMNFILKAVQPDLMDIEYQFGSDEQSNAEDIETVLEAEESRLLQGRSVYNVEIFNYLLAAAPAKLNEPIRRLAVDADSDRTFIEAYLSTGTRQAEFVERLSANWPGVLKFLVGDDPQVRGLGLLDAAIRGADPRQAYELSDEQRAAVAAALPRLSLVKNPQPKERAQSAAQVLEQLDLRIKDLSKVAQPLQNEMAARNLYEITRGNLATIVGDDQLSLDQVKASHDEVYRYLLEHLAQYLGIANRPKTVAHADEFAEILTDVEAADPGSLTAVAAGAAEECLLDDLSGLEPSNWPDIARAHRLRLTVPLVLQYAAELEIDNALADHLTAAKSFEISEGESGRLDLAMLVVNDRVLDDETKVALLYSLRIPRRSIAASQVAQHAHELIPRLVAVGWTSDDEDAFACLGDDEWPVKKALIESSKTFTEYMTNLVLSEIDLLHLTSSEAPDAVKEVLLAAYSMFEDEMPSGGAKNLATWSAATGHQPEPAVLLSLATKGGGPAAEPIIKLTGAQALSIERATLLAILNALGRPFNQLTSPGRDRPAVQELSGLEAVLPRLHGEGIVSSFKKNSKKSRYEVTKRYS